MQHQDRESPSAPLWVACLCAAWCRTCDGYQATLDALRAQFGTRVRWVWVDIEDHADVLDDVDVETFPTLLVGDGQEVVFFGPVLPHPESARQILERALARKLPPISDESARGLFSRFVQAGLVGES